MSRCAWASCSKTRLGADVIYTRDDDTFIPLETRTAIANEQQADLFISIHANSSSDPSARRGNLLSELHLLADALEVAARENAVSEKSIFELQDLVKKIALKEKIDESREFAADVQQSLYSGLGRQESRDTRPRREEGAVRGADRRQHALHPGGNFLRLQSQRRAQDGRPDYRQQIAESLYRGISKYVSGLSGVKVARIQVIVTVFALGIRPAEFRQAPTRERNHREPGTDNWQLATGNCS